MEFRWVDWNVEQCMKHGCTIDEVESIIENAGSGFPRKMGNGKFLVIGRGQGGHMVEVIYLLDPRPQRTLFPIHAMPLTTRRRRR